MKKILRTIKHWLGWILRPRHSFRRIREMRWINAEKPVRSDLPLDNLPQLDLILAETEDQMEEVVGIYKRCPSSLNIPPRSLAKLKEHIALNKEFYLVRNQQGDYVAAIGWVVDKSIMAYMAVEYQFRRGGIGLATNIAMMDLKRRQGVERVYGQVLRKNTQYLSTCLSMGFKIDEEKSKDDYHAIYMDLNPPE